MKVDWKAQYRVCRVCDKAVSSSSFAYALQRFEQQTCSSECSRREMLTNHGCCDKAEIRDCVCHFSTECPDHGVRCIGTHD